jgi:DNA-binding transcriptional MerR regulator
MAVIFRERLEKPCLLCMCGTDEAGYGHRWYRPTHRNELAHRIAYCEAHGLTMADIADVIIRHRCDNPSCIEPTHLLSGTKADNHRDMVIRRRAKHLKGSAHGMAKLTEDQVRYIRERLACGHKGSFLAAQFGVTRTTISQIKRGLIWTHVQ